MARSLVEAGYEDHNEILNKIHEVVGQSTELTTAQIAEIISGYGNKPKPTKSELQGKIKAMQAKMRQMAVEANAGLEAAKANEREQKRLERLIDAAKDELAGHRAAKPKKESPKWDEETLALSNQLADLRDQLKAARTKPKPDAEQAKNERRQKELQKQLDKAKEQLATGNFEKGPPRAPIVYNAQTQALQAEVKLAKREVEKTIRKLEHENRPKWQKVADFGLALQRAMILSGLQTIWKLNAAVIGRLVTEPLENIVGSAVRHIPGISYIATQAPIHGGGLSPSAEMAALRNTFSKETGREVWRTLWGDSHLEAEFGEPHPSDHPYFDWVGRAHGAIKAPAKINAFYRTSAILADYYRNVFLAQGMTPSEANAALSTPTMMTQIGTMAYAEGQRAILLQDNWSVDFVTKGMQSLQNSDNPIAVAFGKALKALLPVVRVPANVVSEAALYGAGAGRAAIEIGKVLSKGIETLTPQQADLIMLSLKKQGIGAVLMAVGWTMSSAFGGLDWKDDDPEDKDLATGDMKINGVVVPAVFLHSAAFTLMQLAASAHKTAIAEGKEGKPKGVAAGLLKSGLLLAEHNPYIGAAERFFKAVDKADQGGMGRYAGKIVSSFVTPAEVREWAKEHDEEGAEPRYRKPGGFIDEIKMGFPGYRQEVPLSDIKQLSVDERLDLWDKSTPAQRKKDEMIKHLINSLESHGENSKKPLTVEQRKRFRKWAEEAKASQ
jgi:hypothetical protein